MAYEWQCHFNNYVCFAAVAVQVCVDDRKKEPTELLESIKISIPHHLESM